MKKQNPSLFRILEILSDGAYHDGTRIGESLGISRAAVWKNIQKLQSYTVKISSIKNKGYALQDPLILLNKDCLISTFPQKNIKLDIFESLPSTQTYLKSITSPFPYVCLTERQTDGKGRLGRHWQSPFGQNIYLSLLYPFQKDISELSGLSLMVSLSILKTLTHFFKKKIPFQLKWPNDIVFDHKKLGGILIDMQAESYGLSTAVIGIGLNVNMMPQECLSFEWTSLRQIYNTYINRNELCQLLLTNLFEDLSVFQEKGFEPFQKSWPLYDALYDEPITLKIGETTISGIAKGINEMGHLLLEKEDKTLKTYASGEASFIRRQNSL
ncbi:MAG: biotin--[acetyl-CoA-carboxylase] ligase [Alphaproteobacteria bacterium 16-39-46]|nr:MAG: biotin--[acetyl-CoA-carboxylase] ligase [Alphaproteobacteria bacterium 16-39-46]OZA40947.1 MAG: biotin--[acetyl-CoA-carboxylase] ligase [Alphaproteobacteria bacterium 17-39-52]HQS85040.1 biotin--[acetyl-CoA-carboxylase] ligase [Alphaproteobacteria bacterium]HQS94773.1 biotin--[acetyl-CoA-carboxylase] ligase [Alphaproteobacteria bacterium]